MEYVNNLNILVNDIQRRLQKSHSNVKSIESILESWCCTPVLERKDNKKDTMLDLEGRMDKFKRRWLKTVTRVFSVNINRNIQHRSVIIIPCADRYSIVSKSGAEIHRIVEENCVTFCTENSEAWLNYKKFIDNIVSEAFLTAVGCRYVQTDWASTLFSLHICST